MRVMLQHVAHARSGDKGNTSNIAVIAYAAELYPLLKEQLTAERVQGVLPGRRSRARSSATRSTTCGRSTSSRTGALGGGVSRSLCLDNYGKALSARAPRVRARDPRRAAPAPARPLANHGALMRRLGFRFARRAALAVASMSALAQYPEQGGAHHRPLSAGRHHRHSRPARRDAAHREARPDRSSSRIGPGRAARSGRVAVAKSAPDGYTLVMGTVSSHGINSALSKTLPYDPVKDFAPVTMVGEHAERAHGEPRASRRRISARCSRPRVRSPAR